jgi:hypothetical protein
MVQAAATGAIDFREADPFNPQWQARLHWILDYISDQDVARLYEYDFLRSVILLSTATDTATYITDYERTELNRNELIESIMPWMVTGPASLEEVIPAMRQKYEEVYGDPDDPVFAAELQRLLDYWDEKPWTSTN